MPNYRGTVTLRTLRNKLDTNSTRVEDEFIDSRRIQYLIIPIQLTRQKQDKFVTAYEVLASTKEWVSYKNNILIIFCKELITYIEHGTCL